MKIYMNVADPGACSYYRAKLPAKYCANQLLDEGIELTCSEAFDPSVGYDAIILHRVVQPHFLPELERLKNAGTKIVIELDDDVWHLPPWNPAHRVFGPLQLDTIHYTFELADQIWVSTQPLADVVSEELWSGGRREKIKVLPNLVDPSDFPEPTRHDDGRVRIVWAGSIHHDADLAMVAPVVEEVIRRHGEKVQVLFFGHWPESLSQWVRIRFTNIGTMIPRKDLAASLGYVDPVDLSDYHATLCALGADIGLCPLVDEQFNHSKSGIKAFEYVLSGAVPVVSAVPPYSDFDLAVRPGGGVGEWVELLDTLIVDAVHRKEELEIARETVLGEHSWSSPAKQTWVDAFKSLKGVA